MSLNIEFTRQKSICILANYKKYQIIKFTFNSRVLLQKQARYCSVELQNEDCWQNHWVHLKLGQSHQIIFGFLLLQCVFILLSPNSVKRWLLDDLLTVHCRDYTSCLEESAPAEEFPVWSIVSVDFLKFLITKFAACSKQSCKSGRAFQIRFGFGLGSGLKLTKISGLNRAWDVLFV